MARCDNCAGDIRFSFELYSFGMFCSGCGPGSLRWQRLEREGKDPRQTDQKLKEDEKVIDVTWTEKDVDGEARALVKSVKKHQRVVIDATSDMEDPAVKRFKGIEYDDDGDE